MNDVAARVLAELELAGEPLKRRILAARCCPGQAASLAERKVRAAIAELTTNGHPIVNQGGGYFIAARPEEFDIWIRQREAAVRSEAIKINRLKAMRNKMIYKRRPFQESLFREG